MGRIFLDHIGGSRLFSCASCDTILTNRSELISTRFTGATGRAFLFNRVVNLNYRLGILFCKITNYVTVKYTLFLTSRYFLFFQ
jgi:hypothetical protein